MATRELSDAEFESMGGGDTPVLSDAEFESMGAPSRRITRRDTMLRRAPSADLGEDLTRPAGTLGQDIPAAPIEVPPPVAAPFVPPTPRPRRDTMLRRVPTPEGLPADDLSAPVGALGQPLQPPLQDTAGPTYADVGNALVDAGKNTAKYITSYDRPGLAHQAAAGVLKAGGGIAGAMRAGSENALDPTQALISMLTPQPVKTAVSDYLGRAAKSANTLADQIAPPEEGFVGAVNSGVQSAAQMGIMLPMAIASRNPAYLMGPLAAVQGGQSYQEDREAGVAPLQSLIHGGSDALIEYATEHLPGVKLLTDIKSGTPVVKMVLNNLAREMPGEQVATLLQDLNQWAVRELPKGKTFMDYVMERPGAAWDTAISTLVTSGLVGAGAKIGRSNAPVNAAQAAEGAAHEGDATDALAAALGAQPLAAPDPRTMAALRRQQTEEFNQQQEARNAGSTPPNAVPPGGDQLAPRPQFAPSNLQVPGTVVPGAPGIGGADQPASAPVPGPAGGDGGATGPAVDGPQPQHVPAPNDHPAPAIDGGPSASTSEPSPGAEPVVPAGLTPETHQQLQQASTSLQAHLQQNGLDPTKSTQLQAINTAMSPTATPDELAKAHAQVVEADPLLASVIQERMQGERDQLNQKFVAGTATPVDIANLGVYDWHLKKMQQAAQKKTPEEEHLLKVVQQSAAETSVPDLIKALEYAKAQPGNEDLIKELVSMGNYKLDIQKNDLSPQDFNALYEALLEAPNAAAAPTPAAEPPAAAPEPAPAAPSTSAPAAQPAVAAPLPPAPEAPGGKPTYVYTQSTKSAKGDKPAVTHGPVQPAGGNQFPGKYPFPASTVTPSPVSQQGQQKTVEPAKEPTALQAAKAELKKLWADPNLPAVVKKDPASGLKKDSRTHALWAATAKQDTVQDANLIAGLDWADSHQRSDLAKMLRKRMKVRIDEGTASPELEARYKKADPYKGKVTHKPTTQATASPSSTDKFGNTKWGKTQPGGQLAKYVSPVNENFWKWFGDSKTVDNNGEPIVFFHGSSFSGQIEVFHQGSVGAAIFAAGSIQFGKNYAGWSGKTDAQAMQQAGDKHFYPIYIRAEKPFDYENPKDVAAVGAEMKKEGVEGAEHLGKGHWPTIESKAVRDILLKLGYDAFYVNEGGSKNIAVFSAHQIKSAVKNSGGYSIEHPSQFHDIELPEYDHADMMEARDEAREDEDYELEQAELDDAIAKDAAGGETIPAEAETPQAGAEAQDAANPKVRHVSETGRPSNYNDAWYEAGLDPGIADSMPFAKQFQTLRELWGKKYGIDVQLGKAPRKWETTSQLKDGYRNVGYMMSLLGLPMKAAGLGGTLKLRLDQMKPGRLGSFNAGTKVMEMPGRSNSFAHEYAHGLDNFIFEKLGLGGTGKQHWFTQLAAGKGVPLDQVPEHLRPLAVSFANLVNALHKDQAGLATQVLSLERLSTMTGADGMPTGAATQAQALLREIAGGKQAASKSVEQTTFVKNAQEADKQGGTNYWKKPAELLARSFESYVAHLSATAQANLKTLGIKGTDEFITKGDKAYLSDASEQFAKMYPKEAERQGIFNAWHDTIDALRAAELLGHKGDEIDVGEALLKEQAGPAHEKEGAAYARLWAREMRAWKKDATKPETEKQKLHWTKRADMAGLGALETAFQSVGSMQGLLNFYQAKTGSPTLLKLNRMLFRTLNQVGNREQAAATIFEEEHQHVQSQNTLQLNKEHDLFGWGHKYTHAEDTYLRHILTGQEDATDADVQEAIKNAPHQGLSDEQRRKLNALAGVLRRQLQIQYRYMTKAGMTVGEADSYLSRQYNREAINDDQEGFLKAAHKVYAIDFDRSAGTSHTNFDQKAYDEALERLGFKYKGDDGAVQPATAQAVRDLRAQQRTLAQLKAKKKALAAEGKDTESVTQAIEDEQSKVDRAIDDVLPMLREDYGEKLAQDLALRMRTPKHQVAMASNGPTSSFKKHRTLPREADTLLAPYMESNIPAQVREYVEKSTRRAVWVKHFGKDGEKLQDMLDQMGREGVDYEMSTMIQRMVESMTGRDTSLTPPKFDKLMANIRMLGTFQKLARSVWASGAEPMQLALMTGNLWDATRIVGGVLRSTFNRASAEDFRKIGERLGVVTLAFATNPNMDFNLSEHYAKKQSRWYGNFFTWSGHTPVTNWQKVQVAMPGGMQFIADLLDRPDHQGSRKELAQWGIPEDRQGEVKKWLDGLKGGVKVEDLVDPNTDLIWDEGSPAGLYARALRNITTHTITDPYKVDRPLLAGNAVASSTFALTGFNFGHWNKFYKPMLRKLAMLADTAVRGKAANDLDMGRVEAIAKQLPILAAAAAAFYAGTFVFSTIRELLYNFMKWTDDDWDEKKKGTKIEALLWLALDRAGFWGPFDPIKQAIVGVKYMRSLSGSMAGPYLGDDLANIDNIMRGVVNPTPANAHKALTSFLMLTAGQALGFAQAAAPGPISGVAAALANQFLGTQAVAGKVADTLGAPKPVKGAGGGASKKPPRFVENEKGELVPVPKGSKQTFVEGPDGTLQAVPKGKKKARFVENARGELVAAP